jgi:hypothetical protein
VLARGPGFEEALLVVDVEPTLVIGRRLRDVRPRALARERGVPMVLGVADATRRIPDGAQVAVDGVAGIVRWMR